MPREKTNLHLICTEKERKNELINAETDPNAAKYILTKYKQRQRRQNKPNITPVGTAGFHGIKQPVGREFK